MAIGLKNNADSKKSPPQPTTQPATEINIETFVETYVRTYVPSTPQPATVNRLQQLEDEGRRSLKLLYIMLIIFFSIVIICFFIPSRKSTLDESIQFEQSNDFDQSNDFYRSNEYEPSIHWESYNSKLTSRPKAPYKSPSLHKISSTKTQVQYTSKATGGYQPRSNGAVQKSRKKG
ncbi:uncharacterized protein LOC132792014 [Drosophila nasuta]|uniref:uncharacterized protein LOC132792014 n=1 Tax=Drosophila nasuta TaxID=42062 RepID=UPI00295E5B37|nr:uncharacterized protein LOC132792014 [Drosophila nasuta]